MTKQKTAKKETPYIDYKTANIMARMYDFITHANYARKRIYDELDSMSTSLRRLQEQFKPIEDPSNWASGLEYNHIPDSLLNISHDACEMGLNHTLFEKLKDRKFRNRFTGWLNPPVLKYSKRRLKFVMTSRTSRNRTHSNTTVRGRHAPDSGPGSGGSGRSAPPGSGWWKGSIAGGRGWPWRCKEVCKFAIP
jgi:hypothetical protein